MHTPLTDLLHSPREEGPPEGRPASRQGESLECWWMDLLAALAIIAIEMLILLWLSSL